MPKNALKKTEEETLRKRADELTMLHAVSLDITASLDLPSLLKAIVEQAIRLLNTAGGCLYLSYPAKKEIECVVSIQTPVDYSGNILKYGQGAAGIVAECGEPLIINDYLNWSNQLWVEGEEHVMRVVLSVPMQWHGELSGVLQVMDSSETRKFVQEDQELLSLFADQAAIAIENAHLLNAERTARAQAEILRESARVVSASLDPPEVLRLILEQLKRVLTFDSASVMMMEEKGQPAMVAEMGYAQAEATSQAASELLKDSPILKRMSQDRQPVLIGDTQQDPDWIWVPGTELVRSFIGVPIVARQKMIGALMIDNAQPNFFSAADLNTVQALAHQMGVAIENARLFTQVAAERRHLGLLYDVVHELASSLDVGTILDRAINLTNQALGGVLGEAFLYLPEEKRLSLRSLHGRKAESIGEMDRKLGLKPGVGLAGWVAESCQAVIVSDVTKDSRWLRAPGLDEDVTSAIVAPIVDDGHLLGVLSVQHEERGVFNNDHLELLKAICQQVGLALSKAQRYQQVQNLVEQLEEEHKRLGSLIEWLPVGVLLLDADFCLLVANQIGCEYLTALNQIGIGEQLLSLGDYALVDLIAHHADALPIEIRLEGSPARVFEVQARPIGGDQIQWVLTLRDVTRERENQERIQMQERLATVGQLAAGIAHDFNNIMAAILVYTDLLSGDLSAYPASRERLTIIREQVQRAASLIRQILDFSRRSIMEQSTLDLLPFLKELNKLLRRVLPETIHLELICRPGVYLVNADPTRLQQVFMNLALNASDAMPEGGDLRFSVDAFQLKPGEKPPTADLPSGDWVRIIAMDTGIGIQLDALPHIFEPFFTTKPAGQGTGLGLAQVYGIVKQHNGYIDVFSQIGGGTAFTIYLPAKEYHEEKISVQGSTPLFDGAGAVVLLAEDDYATRDALRALLETLNFHVLAASNGVEALAIFSQERKQIAFIVSDIVMPRMGGMELYQEIKKRWPAAKMLLMTGHPLGSDDQVVLEKGTVHWLQKPFSMQDFSEAVQLLLTPIAKGRNPSGKIKGVP
jgi:two-component system, cell cycle sensor histidine kinase and response regulator CckA